MSDAVNVYTPRQKVRIITATSLFDGHDVSINMFRRILQSTGVEVIHLGHNRSVKEIVDAAIEEDAQGIAVSSYQGGHIEFFKYIVDLLKEHNASDIKVFGGGGGVIVPEEIQALHDYGVTRIFSPEDGTKMGLQGMINHMVKAVDFSTDDVLDVNLLSSDNKRLVGKAITAMEQAQHSGNGHLDHFRAQLQKKIGSRTVPVMGITGTGGAGKSSLIDELVLRMTHDVKDVKIAVISSDVSRRKTGGALLGDRIRMNAIDNDRVYMRSLATRKAHSEIPEALGDVISVVKAAGFDFIIAETAGIGQGDSQITDQVDCAMYVMTAEFGAASQLEKIDMLDYADLIAVNKFEKRGAEDAVRDVRKQVQRNRSAWEMQPEDMPVFGTIASKFNDDGVTALYQALLETIFKKTGVKFEGRLPKVDVKTSSSKTVVIPPERTRYLSEIADTVRDYHKRTEIQAQAIRKVWHIEETAKALDESLLDGDKTELIENLKKAIDAARRKVDGEAKEMVTQWEDTKDAYTKDELVYKVRGKEIRVPLYTQSLSRQKIPKISLPKFKDPERFIDGCGGKIFPDAFHIQQVFFP